jgi:hypothetical protein
MREARAVSVPVPSLRLANDDSTMLLGDLGGTVGRTVVADDDFTGDAGPGERATDLIDAIADGFFFVATTETTGEGSDCPLDAAAIADHCGRNPRCGSTWI